MNKQKHEIDKKNHKNITKLQHHSRRGSNTNGFMVFAFLMFGFRDFYEEFEKSKWWTHRKMVEKGLVEK